MRTTGRKLLAKGVNPDLKAAGKAGPLWTSAANGELMVVNLLLETRAVDVDYKTVSGRWAIFWTPAYGFSNVVELLLAEGAYSDFKNCIGEIPLLSYHNCSPVGRA